MKKYISRRLISLLPILLGITFLAFVIINLSPSNPAEVALRVNNISQDKIISNTFFSFLNICFFSIKIATNNILALILLKNKIKSNKPIDININW